MHLIFMRKIWGATTLSFFLTQQVMCWMQNNKIISNDTSRQAVGMLVCMLQRTRNTIGRGMVNWQVLILKATPVIRTYKKARIMLSTPHTLPLTRCLPSGSGRMSFTVSKTLIQNWTFLSPWTRRLIKVELTVIIIRLLGTMSLMEVVLSIRPWGTQRKHMMNHFLRSIF